MSHLRFTEVEVAFNRAPIMISVPSEVPSQYYAKYVFNKKKMYEYLPKPTYDAIIRAIDNKERLDPNLANDVANGMRKWALDNGVTHYTHWFHPLTDGTAEKHDSFIAHDGRDGVIEEFSGKLLMQQEPDASSFPNGGIRNTFEARGYSAWDISSPAFIHDNTLCIPTIFIAYSGESLDYKTPLLRAINSIDKAGTAVAQFFDPKVKHVISYLGWEQEFFLVDEALYAARPDLAMTGRTLMGHESAKNQQLEDHYFGAIPMRVEQFMIDLEIECHKLGIPVKTSHNEVAPNQFEIAPIYEEMNLANDHNLLLMSLMSQVARRHHFRVLFHEKPFAGINGSGKHNNWSLGTDTGVQLFKPGKTTKENLQFMTFVACVMAATYKHNGLLKASIVSATNAQRLGGNEAPPTIISMFLGSQLSKVVDSLVNDNKDDCIDFKNQEELNLQVSQIPEILIDNTDRNRTSPFAFTGNRFEFRAVGSSANSASAMIALNAAVADQLMLFKESVDQLLDKGVELNEAIITQIKALLKHTNDIRFDGNGYSQDWQTEAIRRGLDCETSVPLILDHYLSKQSIDMFKRTNVLTDVELYARNEVKWEMYIKKVQIEARVFGDLALNHIVPVATRYMSILLDNVYKIKTLFPADKGEKIAENDMAMIEKMESHIQFIKDKVAELVKARKVANQISNMRLRAIQYHDNVAPLMESIRYHIDKLELMVDDEMWPLPKYRELLFIR
ncbi:MAG: glutamine synthetase III [Bacteroidales bacterium]|nr:glutamine synthetase III [Candidatus Sodaliphilus aphodohippi]